MEWSKIKNILIIALILTDILLISLLLFSDVKNLPKENSDALADSIAVLEKNNIIISAQIPEVPAEMSALTLTYDKDNGSFFYTASEPIAELTEDTALKTAENFISELELPKAENNHIKAVDTYPADDGSGRFVVTFGSYYNDNKLENSYILCFVSPEGVTEMLKNHATADATGNSGQEILSASSALLKYMNKEKTADPNCSKNITDISLVYMVDSPYDGNITSDTAFPAWKITDSDSNITYISAHD